MNGFRLFRRRRAALAISIAMPLFAGAATAQERADASALAGVGFPEQSWAWPDDPDGAKRNTVETAADLFERSCGPTEYHAWQAADPAAAEALVRRTDAAFQEAGWTYLETVLADPVQAHLVSKDGRALVLTWVTRPEQEAQALFLCEARADAAPGQAPSRQSGAEPPAGNAAATPATEASPTAETVRDDSGDESGSVVLATGLVFSLIGFAFAGSTIRTRHRADAAARWPRALATVVSSEVVEETGRDSDGHLETHYVPVVRYSYEARGQALQSARIRVNDLAFSRRSKAQEIVAKYPAGAQVTMRYDPADPTNAVLETVKPGIGTAIFGGVFLVLGVLLSLAGFASFG